EHIEGSPPLAIVAAADVRLAEMVKDEALPRKCARESHGGGQLARVHQDVVRQIEAFEPFDPGEKRRAVEKAIGLSLHDVPHACEARAAGEPLEIRLDALGLQVDPADDPGNEWIAICKVEEPFGLL